MPGRHGVTTCGSAAGCGAVGRCAEWPCWCEVPLPKASGTETPKKMTLKDKTARRRMRKRFMYVVVQARDVSRQVGLTEGKLSGHDSMFDQAAAEGRAPRR